MSTVRKSFIPTPSAPAAPAAISKNENVTWEDQDLADAFVEFAQSQPIPVTIFPDTAMQIATNIRSKFKDKKEITEMELKSFVLEDKDKMFPSSTGAADTQAALDIIKITGQKIAAFKKKLAQRVSPEEQAEMEADPEYAPIEADEEAELRGEILNDIVIPFKTTIAHKINNATRKYMRELMPIEAERRELEAYINDTTKIDALWAAAKAETKGRRALLAFRAENKIRKAKVKRALELLNSRNVLKSRLLRLEVTNNYLREDPKVDAKIIDQYHGVDGLTKYFYRIFEPQLKNLADIIMTVRRGIILPEVTAETRLKRDWLLRHHNTTSYQDKGIGPSLDNIDMTEFAGSDTYEEMIKNGIPEETIDAGIRKLNSLPLTWRKGQAIYMLLDPPAQKTINEDIPTLMSDSETEWKPDIITNQPFNIEKGKFEEQKSQMELGTKPRAMTKERKLAEASNQNAHWSVLFNLSRNQKVDATGKTRAEKFIESLPEDVRNNEDVQAKAAAMEEEDHLGDQEVINAALHNPSTPDWVLMKAASTGYAEKIRRDAKAILKTERGIVPKLNDDGKVIKDKDTNDFVWEREPGFTPRASIRQAQGVVPMSAPQAGSSTQQSINNSVQSIDNNIQNHQAQIDALQVQKRNQQQQLQAIPPAAKTTTNPSSNAQTQAAQPNAGGMPSTGVDAFGAPIQPMAGEVISFRKLGQYSADFDANDLRGAEEVDDTFADDTNEQLFSEPQQPEEGDFVYDDASSDLSISGEHFIGHFVEWDDVVDAIRAYAKKHNHFPNVWQISDHGNAHLVEDFRY